MAIDAFLILRQQIERFTPLTEAEWAMLVPHLRIETLEKHQFFAEEGKVARDVALVL